MEVDETDLEVFVENRFRSFKHVPEMWGSSEAIELGAITVLEMKCLIRTPEKIKNNPRIVISQYHELSRQMYKTGSGVLSQVLPARDFAEAVEKIGKLIRAELYGHEIQAH